MRLHVLGLPHTRTSRDFNACAYTGKVLRFCAMMSNAGHEVIHYGAEGSDPVCSTHVTCITADEQARYFGLEDERRQFPAGCISYDPAMPYWRVFNHRCTAEVLSRIEPRDFLCVIGGTAQEPVAREIVESQALTVEYGIGYYGTFAKYRCFESYTHQSACYAMQSRDPDASLYDCVIPNYFDVNDFPARTDPISKSEYLLYVGRLVSRKGIRIAVETAAASGMRLVIAGGGDPEPGLDLSGCELVGYVDINQRAKLMASARAVMVPTTYMEPFGGVAVEAQMVGTPVITTDHAAFSETVIQGVTGFRCRTLAQFVASVKAVTELSPSVIREVSVERYSMEVIAPRFDRWLRTLYGLWGEGWNALGVDAVRDL